MSTFSIVFAVFTIFIVLCNGEQGETGSLGPSEIATDSIQDIVDDVRSDVELLVGLEFPMYVAVSYREQVVAGDMFYVKVQVGTDADDYIHVKVWGKLDGTTEFLNVQTGKNSMENIVYFTENSI